MYPTTKQLSVQASHEDEINYFEPYFTTKKQYHIHFHQKIHWESVEESFQVIKNVLSELCILAKDTHYFHTSPRTGFLLEEYYIFCQS